MKLKKGDNVLVVAGKDKGKTAKILKSIPKAERILVEGVNLRKKHLKPKRQGEKGQVISVPFPLDISNVKIVCSKCNKAVRVGYELKNDKKFRICKKCKAQI